MSNLYYIKWSEGQYFLRQVLQGPHHESTGHILCCACRVLHSDVSGRYVDTLGIVQEWCAPVRVFFCVHGIRYFLSSWYVATSLPPEKLFYNLQY